MGPGMTQDSWHITGCEVVVIQAQNNLFRIPCAAFAWSIQKNSNGKCYRLLHRYKTMVYTETPAESDSREAEAFSKEGITDKCTSPHTEAGISSTNKRWTVLLLPEWVGLQEVKRLPIKVFCDFGVAWAEWAHALQKKLSNTVIRDVVFPVFPH